MRSGLLALAALTMMAPSTQGPAGGFPRFSLPAPKRRDPVPSMVTAPDNDIAKWNAEVDARRAAKKAVKAKKQHSRGHDDSIGGRCCDQPR